MSNSPFDLLVDRCGPDGKRVFIVDLFVGKRALPSNIMEVLARRDEIVYSERIRSDLRYREMINSYRRLVDSILGRLEPDDIAKIKQRPEYIQLMGDGAPSSIVRIVRPAHEEEQAARDYDFSESAIQSYQSEGYAVAKAALGRA